MKLNSMKMKKLNCQIMTKAVTGWVFLSGIALSGFAQESVRPLSAGSPWGTTHPVSGMIAELDRNNTQLQAIQQGIVSEKAGNRVGLNPDDPRVGINYLRPNPRLSDRRLDFEITQELEFPTVYGWRKKVARQQDMVLDQHYLVQRSEIMSLALQTWLEWVYLGEKQQMLRSQQEHADQLATAYQRAFDAGKINVLERNKARLHATNANKAVEFNQIELESAWNTLLRLNGGRPFTTALPEQYPADWLLPASFEDWFAQVTGRSGLLQALSDELEVSRTQESLAKAMKLPNLSVGFMREQDIEVDFRGVTFGLSIPLWQNQHRSKHARLQTLAQESRIFDAQQQFELEQQHLFRKAAALKNQSTELQEILRESKEPILLRRALELGEINLVDYLVEQSMYYELQEKALQAELEYYQVQAEMRKWLF